MGNAIDTVAPKIGTSAATNAIKHIIRGILGVRHVRMKMISNPTRNIGRI